MSPTDFIGSALVAALGGLDSAKLFGPWRGRRPTDARPSTRFAPAMYDEDHAHAHSELCLLLKGRCRFSLNHATAVMAAGDLVFCPAGQPHAESFVRRGESYQLGWWSLHPEEPTLHVTRYAPRDGFVLEHWMKLSNLPAEVQRRLANLRQWAGADEMPKIDGLREALLTLALALYRRLLDGGASQLASRAQLVRRAVAFVRANTEAPLSLAQVSQAVRISPNYLTGLFRAETGTPLGRFILEERVARAQQRLRMPGASVTSVAIELGFPDPFTFSRAFKRVTGSPPRNWLAGEA